MPAVSNMDYVHKRFEYYVRRLEAALKALNYAQDEIAHQVGLLRRRLMAHDYHLKSERPISHLQSGRNVTRFFLRSAVQFGPGERARVERLRQEYTRKVAEIRQQNPHAVFFSFEAQYAGKIKPTWSRFKHLLVL